MDTALTAPDTNPGIIRQQPPRRQRARPSRGRQIMKALGFVSIAAASFAAVVTFAVPGTVEAGARRDEASAAQAQPPALSDQVVYLVRSTLLALDGANKTGNYSVLRESATQEFQHRNSAADLALIFADLRRRGVDLTLAAVRTPRLSLAPAADAQGRLRLAGQIGSGAETVGFDLVFVVAGSAWKLDAISIAAAPRQVGEARTGTAN